MRRLWTALLPVVGLAWRTGEALAHHGDDLIEEALARGAGPPPWVPWMGAVATLALLVVLGQVALWRLPARRQGSLRHLEATAGMLLLWLHLGYLQDLASGPPAAGLLMDLGYVILPLALLAVWLFVIANFGHVIRAVLGRRPYLATAAAASLVFLGFYLWSTNLVAPPEADERLLMQEQLPGTGAFVVPFMAYGPLAVWPNIEFWVPQVGVFGALSLGTGLFALTLALLVGTAFALLAFSLRHGRFCAREAGAFGGVSLVALGTNFCCCCAPAIYPVLALIFGTAAASSAGAWIVGSTSPFYDLAPVGSLASALLAVGLLSRRVQNLGLKPGCPPVPGSPGRGRRR